MQAGSGASPSTKAVCVLASGPTVCACSSKQQKQKQKQKQDSLPPQTNPCTHPPSRQTYSSDQFFVSHAIPLLASEASLLLYPYITIALRGSCHFFPLLFLGNRLAHDWSSLGVLGVLFLGGLLFMGYIGVRGVLWEVGDAYICMYAN